MTQDLRPIVVTRNATMMSFTLTRAGLYKLAKLFSTDYGISFDSTVKLIKNYAPFEHIIGRETLTRIAYSLLDQTRIANAPFEFAEFPIINVHRCVDGKYRFDSDSFLLNGYHYPKSYRKYLNQCSECGTVFFDQSKIESFGDMDIIDNIRSSDIGIDGYCNDCLPRQYRQCSDCGRIIDTYGDDYAVINDDYVCGDCLSNGDYYRCDNCGEWFHSESCDAQFPGDNCYCCSECAEEDGWHWSDRYDEWTQDEDNEVDEVVTDYHSHDYEPIGDEYTKANQKHDLYIGRETEVDGRDRYDFDGDYFYGLERMLKNTCFFETDGSLDSGFEIITQPMTEKAFFQTDWKTPFEKLIKDGWRSHDTTTCGTHFHFSKWYLGYTEKQQRDSAKKVCRFFQLYAEDIAKIARRKFGHYCRSFESFDETITSKTDFYDLCGDRYWAVNLTNLSRSKKTIEIRICKGTLNANTMLASADFFLHIVRNAKSIAWKNIENLSLWLKGIKDKRTIDYIKSKDAFVGAF